MTVYVADIGGKGVAAFEADSDSDAERLARDRVFRDDLMVLTTGGLPLWDGVSDIEIRHARPGEAAKWRASRARAINQGNIEGAEECLDRLPCCAHRPAPTWTVINRAKPVRSVRRRRLRI